MKKFERLLKRLSKPMAMQRLVFVGVFAIIGCIVILSARAASNQAAFEPENGTQNGTSIVTDSGASGSKAIKFGAPIDDGSNPLAFDMPSKATLRASSKKVFAHYFTPYPISFNNKPEATDYYTTGYLNPEGENLKHAGYGGFLRDRPLVRAVSTSSTWALDDMKTEVNQAIAGGMDGFTLDILSVNTTGDNWKRVELILQAAQEVDSGFKLMLMPDATSMGSPTPQLLATRMATLAKTYTSVYRLSDGRVVISPFKPEDESVTYWTDFINSMKNDHGLNVAFVPCFLDYGANKSAYASISYGSSNWGNRNPGDNVNLAANMTDAHSRGKIWMQPVSLQDNRPRSGIYDEANNTENLRVTWEAAISGGAEWVQIPTWNDYSENTQIAPSKSLGWNVLDINAYYLVKYKQSGTAPAIQRDAVYVSHRTQKLSAVQTYVPPATRIEKDPETGEDVVVPIVKKLMTIRAGGSPGRDTVEVYSMLTAPADITVNIGGTPYTYAAPAGVYTKVYPLAIGTVSAKAVRGSQTIADVTSPHTVTNTPYVQDFLYHFVGSRRD